MAGSYLTDDRAAHLGLAESRLVKALSLAPNYAAAHCTLAGVLVTAKPRGSTHSGVRASVGSLMPPRANHGRTAPASIIFVT
jgi:hypothetical protein